MKKQGIPFDRKILNVLLFFNFVFLFTVGVVEGLSRLILLSSIVLFCILMIRASILRSLRFPRLLMIYIAFWIYTVFSMFWAPDLDVAMHTFGIFTSALFSVGVFWISLYYTDFRKVLCYGVVVITVIQVFFLLIADPLPAHENRIGGLADNPNDTAMELSMMAFLAMILLRNWIMRYGVIFLGMGGSLLTGTRKIFFTILGLAIMAFWQFSRYLTASRQRLIFFVVAGLLIFCTAMLAAGPLIDKLTQTATFVRQARRQRDRSLGAAERGGGLLDGQPGVRKRNGQCRGYELLPHVCS